MVVQQRSSYLPTTNDSSVLPLINSSSNSIPDTIDNSQTKYQNINMAVMSSSGRNKTIAFIKSNYTTLCICLVLYSIIAGYMAGIQPINKFRYFSYHPLLMTLGMIGSMSIGTITKKLGGYANTKVDVSILFSLVRKQCNCRMKIPLS
jgi:hypothetical protein